MSAATTFDEINEAKATMSHIYDQPDPRAYVRELRKLNYAIPGSAKPIFQTLIGHLQRWRNSTVHVLDIGCSYGVNAALLKHDLSMAELYEHWSQPSLARAEPEEIVARDRKFFDGLDRQDAISVIGLDPASSAIAFGEETGLLYEGYALDLENEPLPSTGMENLSLVDLVISTGCVGYVTEKSFDRLLPTMMQGRPPWIANFVLRMFPFDAIAESLAERGYVTEKLESRTFPQRRFASGGEARQVMRQLSRCGVDPEGEEAEGHLVAEFFLSRPVEEAAEASLEELLAVRRPVISRYADRDMADRMGPREN